MKKLCLDIDWTDLCYGGDGSATQLEKIFDRMVKNHFSGAIIDCFYGGEAYFETPCFPLFHNPLHIPWGEKVMQRLKEYPVLSTAIRLAKERSLTLLPYLRLNDDAGISDYTDQLSFHPLFQAHPEYWLKSRCSNHSLVGTPCYAYPEVRELFLLRMEELWKLGFPGIYIGSSRFHTLFISPYWGPSYPMDIWGFNPPVVEEYARHTGVDLNEGTVVEQWDPTCKKKRLSIKDGPECDYRLLRSLHGQWLIRMLQEFRKRHRQAILSLESDWIAVLPGRNASALPFMYSAKDLLQSSLINGFTTCGNYQGSPDVITDARNGLPDLQKYQILLNAQLNDILSPTGGEAVSATSETVRRYVESIRNAPCDVFLAHEAYFIEQSPEREKLWEELGRLVS